MCAAEIDHWIYHQSIETFFAGWTNSAVTHDALKIGVGGWKKAGLVILFSGQNGKTICMFQKCLGREYQGNHPCCRWTSIAVLGVFFSIHRPISPSVQAPQARKNTWFFGWGISPHWIPRLHFILHNQPYSTSLTFTATTPCSYWLVTIPKCIRDSLKNTTQSICSGFLKQSMVASIYITNVYGQHISVGTLWS